MTGNLVAKASTTDNASRATVWKALLDPAAVKQYMFGTTVASDFKKGRPITFSSERPVSSREPRPQPMMRLCWSHTKNAAFGAG